MKALLESLIRRRNPNFRFDETVSGAVLLGLARQKLMAGIRGLLRMPTQPGLFVGKGVSFFNRTQIELGRYVNLGDHVHLSALGRGKLKLGNHVSLGAFSRVVVSTSFNHVGEFIHIGDNVGIGEFAYLGGGGGLSIGDDCIVGQYFSCHPENHCFDDAQTAIRHQGVTRQGISLGRGCWVGAKVTLLDGVSVGDHSVIAAGAVVTQSFPPYSVIGGVPARLIKSRIPAEKQAA